jgi:hypothetical protein
MGSGWFESEWRRPSGRLVLALLGLGSLLVLGSLATILKAARSTDSPGKLVARRPELTWRHSAPAKGGSKSAAVEDASAVFEVENIGDLPVRVVSVEASCGCPGGHAVVLGVSWGSSWGSDLNKSYFG